MAAKLHIPWARQPLGRVTDADLARSIGCSSVAVATARRKRGIVPLRPQAPRNADLSVAAPFLGKYTDRDVARLAGISHAQARRARLEAGAATTRIDWSAEPLGTVPDSVLARRHGVDNKVVAEARWRRGIEPWNETRKCPCGAPFKAFHMRQRFCSFRCQRYHWQMRKELGLSSEMADVQIALWAFKRTAKEKSHGMEELSRLAQRHPGGARASGQRRDRRRQGAR